MSQKLKDFDEAGKGSGDAPTTGHRNVELMTDLIKRQKAMETNVAASIDPRRGKNIVIEGDGHIQFLYIDGDMWAEVQWSGARQAWCIQDRCGHCLDHIEHFHVAVKGDSTDPKATRQQAVDLAKEMIRDGRMPSPEQAREAYQKRTGKRYPR